MSKIRLVNVTNGVQYVDIADANLRILCGCPADVVKHLMRRGLITETSVGGVTFETGPNAILLSDVMVQSGNFANLAEFPVLQMLYRQGMILPKHPNNTGQRPLLIGLENQIKAQLDYIYRGNYGLVSEDELTSVGVPPDIARMLMRIKLRFAFGRIQPMDELLEACPVGRERMEIRNGVFIQRYGLNVYHIEYGDEAVDVNLNLGRAQTYASPYPLGTHSIHREYFSVIHSGEGDGWDFDRPCMGSVVCFQGRLFLVDAGPNLDAILGSLSVSVNEIEGIFHTHCHDDHFAGLTALIHSDHKLRYFAVPSVRASVTKKLSALLGMEETQFSKFFDVRDLKEGKWNDIGGLGVMPRMSPHPVETTVFRFSALGPRGYRTYDHLADIAAARVLDSMVTDDETAPGLSRDDRERVQTHYTEKADLKKVDIGGGLIHGDAVDFRDDPSEKIILAHIARPLSPQERLIGSGADFGSADVLIPASQDYERRLAFSYLQSYFPGQPAERLQILLNNEVRRFNPHEIMVREMERMDEVFLILSGNAEGLSRANFEEGRLTAGAMLGEVAALTDEPARETFRATSYLTALILPVTLYNEFQTLYGDRAKALELGERRGWLRRTRYFGGGLSFPMLNYVIGKMRDDTVADGPTPTPDDEVFLIRSGTLKRFLDGYVIETIGDGEVFNEPLALFDHKGRTRVHSIGRSEIWAIPSAVVDNIPILRWKLFETYRRRLQLIRDIEGD